MPECYWETFIQAYLTFNHQTVFNVKKNKCVPLTQIGPHQELVDIFDDLEFLGELVPTETTQGIAWGDIDDGIVPEADDSAETLSSGDYSFTKEASESSSSEDDDPEIRDIQKHIARLSDSEEDGNSKPQA